MNRMIFAVLLTSLQAVSVHVAANIDSSAVWNIVPRQDSATAAVFGYQAVLSIGHSMLAFQCTADGREQLGVKFAGFGGPSSTERVLGAYTLGSQWVPVYLDPLHGGPGFEIDPSTARLHLIGRLRFSSSVGFRAKDGSGVDRRTGFFDLVGYALAVDRTRELCRTL